MVVQEISPRRIKAKYAAMEKFDQKSVLMAAKYLFKELNEQQTKLSLLSGTALAKPVRWKTKLGDFVIRGPEDHTYAEGDLDNVVFLLDLGGNNTYTTPVGAGIHGKIRIAIDLGENISVRQESNTGPNAGAGIFGIGVFALLNPQGVKNIQTLSFSQGCGMGGVGALITNGRVDMKGVRFVQGAGVYGVGLYLGRQGDDSHFWAERNGQGLGMSRGVGLFSFQGNKSTIKGGLVQPDPREPKGSVSLCQGVGFGRRAYVGGGVGLAVVAGDHNTVKGSYFSQGCGYWHSAGVFRLRGNNCTLQARRYDLGTGVHSAFGNFQLLGNNNRVLNWGVGPAYGWDTSVGTSLIEGSGNEVQATWATGMASIDSLSFSYWKGDRNKLLVPSFGSGRYFHGRLSYSLQVLNGEDNHIQLGKKDLAIKDNVTLMATPWGAFEATGLTFTPDLKLDPPVWEKHAQEKTIKRERLNLQGQIKQAFKKAPLTRVSDLIDVAGAFSLDKKSPREALQHLMKLPESDVIYLLEALEPAAVDQIIYLRIVLAAFGKPLAEKIIEQFDEYGSQKKHILLRHLGFHRPQTVVPFLEKLIQSTDTSKEATRLRLGAIGSLGIMLNKDAGTEPGQRAILEKVLAYIDSRKSKKDKKALKDFLYRIRTWNAYGGLDAILHLDTKKRLQFFPAIPQDITSFILTPGSEAFLDLVEADQMGAKKNIEDTLALLDKTEKALKPHLYKLIKSTITRNILVGLKSLNQIGHPEDVSKIVPLLDHKNFRVREMAAVGLGKMGDAALPIMETIMASGTTRKKKQVMAAMPHAITRKAKNILKMGIKDPNPEVCVTAISVINNLPPVLKRDRKKLVRIVKKRIKKEENANIRLAGLLLE